MGTESQLLDRFLHYVSVDTHAIEADPGQKPTHPSNPAQTKFIDGLESELYELGLASEMTTRLEDSSLMVCLPATEGCEEVAHVALVAHVDTYPGQPGVAMPMFVYDYDGGDIELPKDGVVIPASDLEGLEGKTILTASGDSILGADDKAGVAIIMHLLEKILRGEITRHGRLTFLLCVDEEIGELGVEFLPKEIVNDWDVFWTLDGLEAGSIDVGCFYGAACDVTFRGHDAHPGVDGDKLHSALYAACQFVADIGIDEYQPWETDDEEGFIYVTGMTGCTPTETAVKIIPRYFDPGDLEGAREAIRDTAEGAADQYGITFEVSDMTVQYVSTEEAIGEGSIHVELVEAAMDELGIEWEERRVRGGTDGAMLNMVFPEVPAPNLGVGYRNCHQRTEFLVVEEFEVMARVIERMIELYIEEELDEDNDES